MWHLQCWINMKRCLLETGGGHSHQAPAWVKTCHETKINRGAAFALLSVVSLCACSKGDDSPQLLQHFPKTSRCTRLELHQWKNRNIKETMSCMVNYHVFTERLIPSASIPRPPWAPIGAGLNQESAERESKPDGSMRARCVGLWEVQGKT